MNQKNLQSVENENKVIEVKHLGNNNIAGQEHLEELRAIIWKSSKRVSQILNAEYRKKISTLKYYSEKTGMVFVYIGVPLLSCGMFSSLGGPDGNGEQIGEKVILSSANGDPEGGINSGTSFGWNVSREKFDEILLELQKKGKIIIPENREFNFGGESIGTDEIKNAIFETVKRGSMFCKIRKPNQYSFLIHLGELMKIDFKVV